MKDLVKAGRLDVRWGKAYDRIFDARQQADYLELFEFTVAECTDLLQLAQGFVEEMKRLLASGDEH